MSALVTPSLLDAGPLILGVSWSLVGVSALFLLLRLYVKCTRHRGLWWDDHVLAASWVSKSRLVSREDMQEEGKQVADNISMPFLYRSCC